jgi:hypothetical protein
MKSGLMTASRLVEYSLRDRCDALCYERSLLDFIGGFWRCIEPKGFQSNWHVEAICDHLEAVADRQIKRGLLINIPPRHMKSLGAPMYSFQRGSGHKIRTRRMIRTTLFSSGQIVGAAPARSSCTCPMTASSRLATA